MTYFKNSIHWFCGTAIVAFTCAAPALANTYYLSTSGIDSAAGTVTAPIASFWRANQLLHPGDTLIVQPGTYMRATNPFNVTVGGTANAWITIIGNATSPPQIIGNAQSSAIWINSPYIDISGFNAKDGDTNTNSAIEVTGTHHVNIHGNSAHDSGCAGILAHYSDYITIANNVVYSNAGTSPAECSGISLGFGTAFDNASGYHNFVSGNISYQNMNKTLVASGVHAGYTTDGSGIIIDTLNSNGNTGTATLVDDNVSFDNGGSGIRVFLSTQVVVTNNTSWNNNQDPNAYGPYHGEIYLHSVSQDYVYNNIAVTLGTAAKQGTASSLLDVNATGDVYDYNMTVGPMAAGFLAYPTWGTHNIAKSPAFVTPANNPLDANFALKPTSGAIGMGSMAWAPPANILGVPNTTSVDIGAY